ncbi:MAG: radical SAM protein [Candidatus Gracilibacteria bacterium]
MKTNIVLHITTFCNYSCSYCDVLKNNKQLSKQNIESILSFIKDNKNNISNFKFFGGEPLSSWNNIKYIIDNSRKDIGNNYEIVTNATLLNDNIGLYFKKYFSKIFFSIDTENIFDYQGIISFINKHKLKDKLYFNLVINPGKEEESLSQFYKLYYSGFRLFNILPVYFTKNWKRENLENLSQMMKEILNLSLKDNNLELFGFQKEKGEESKLSYNTFFINIDSKIYFSDIVSTNFGYKLKEKLYLGNVKIFNLEDFKNIDFEKQKNEIKLLKEEINFKVKGQKELYKIMDYFSTYLNKKNAK